MINKVSIILFFVGVVLGLQIYFYSEDSYEEQLFGSLASEVKKNIFKSAKEPFQEGADKDSLLLLSSLHLVYNTIDKRQQLFHGITTGLKADIINPATVDLMTGKGSCGSYSVVTARLLKSLGFDTRIIQMKVGNVYGGHIILEAKHNDKWVVLDPLYNLYFTRSDGALASFADVQNNWNYYKKQVPSVYDERYQYEDSRYSNWDKIPIVMPTIKKTLDVMLGKEKADAISLRVIFIKKFNVFFILASIVQGLLLLYMFKILYRTNKEKRSPKLLHKADPDNGSKEPSIIILQKPQATENIR